MKITVSFQTQQVPPPYAYRAVMQLHTTSSAIKVDFELSYYGREQLTEEELIAEGFSSEDDVTWSGHLNECWLSTINKLSEFQFAEEPDGETYLHIEVDSSHDGFPENFHDAHIQFQELVQAVLEQAGVANPLVLNYKNGDRKSNIAWDFSRRLILHNNESSDQWEVGRKILESVYNVDYQSLKAKSKPVHGSINIEGDDWYFLPKDTWNVVLKLIDRL